MTKRLFEPVDAASIVAYRIVFGLLLLVATLRFFAHGWIADYYETPTHFFHYDGFSWVKPHPYMHAHFAVMAVLALMIAIGAWFRISVAAFGLLFAYAHLVDKTNYLNHYFLIIWLCLLMTFLPMNRLRATVPAWVLWALRAQVGLVYVFGGIAKLKYDWLVDAQPLRIWLSANTDFPVIGSSFDQPWVAYVFAYAGLLFDLSIVPLLLWRRTQPFAYVAVVAFHLATARLFHLGMFPWLMMASSLLFLPPDWPRRFMRRSTPPPTESPTRRSRLVLALLGGYFGLHILVPFRHVLYPGDVCWTEEGFRFSWNVMVMEKTGSVVFHVTEPGTNRRWEVMPGDYLTPYQTKMMAPQPDMILELAHVIAGDYRARGVRDPEVRVDAFVSLNGRRRARLIDPSVDLARESDGLAPKPWILPHPDEVHDEVARDRTAPGTGAGRRQSTAAAVHVPL